MLLFTALRFGQMAAQCGGLPFSGVDVTGWGQVSLWATARASWLSYVAIATHSRSIHLIATQL